MACTLGFRLSSVILTWFLASLAPLAGQVLTTAPARSAQSANALQTTSAATPPAPLPNQDAEGDFRKRVEARWKAARKGQIEVYLVPDTTNPERFVVRVVVTRAPAGSDGMTAVSSYGSPSWSTLLKLDDEVLVRLSPEDAGTFDVEPHEGAPDALIRHLDPGGHAEWTWSVKRTGRPSNRVRIQAEVVYRRTFSPAGEPIVTYHSADTVISLAVGPDHSAASPHASAQ